MPQIIFKFRLTNKLQEGCFSWIFFILCSLQLSDEGGGIPRSQIDKLFNYMYTTAPHPPKPGTTTIPPLVRQSSKTIQPIPKLPLRLLTQLPTTQTHASSASDRSYISTTDRSYTSCAMLGQIDNDVSHFDRDTDSPYKDLSQSDVSSLVS